MTHRFVFHPRIEDDVRVAMSDYDVRASGLGERFKRTFYATVDAILFLPEKHVVKADGGIRTRLMRPFPYLIFYAVEENIVYVAERRSE